MARFEMTLTGGERVLVDYAAGGLPELLTELNANAFLLFTEVRGDSTSLTREAIVATAQITVIRLIDSDTRQSSTFRPKR